MSAPTLSAWLQRIEALHPADIELGLERVNAVYRRLPPATVPRVITVAGTNGKGSTVECLTRIALQQGARVGTYTSPHLVRFNERMCVNGRPASDEDIVRAFEVVEQARGEVVLTYFEFTTLAALALFRAAPLDLWVLEVGLGGRLDAVNLVSADVAVITTIGLDHQDWLGDNREVIGAEKAGIMRAGSVAICSDPHPPSSIGQKARECGAALFQLGRDFTAIEDGKTWRFAWRPEDADERNPAPTTRAGLSRPRGAVLANIAGAFAALAALNELPSTSALTAAMNAWSLPGRLQRLDLDVPWWLDVAHNTESALLLKDTLLQAMAEENLHTCVVIIGMLGDKPVDDVLSALSAVATQWFVVGLDSPRALPAEQLAQRVKQVSDAPVEVLQSVAAGMAVARARVGALACVAVTGSFHTVGPALAWLGDAGEASN